MWHLLAEDVSTTVLTGAGGWAGAGLLGMVLAWLLLKHLPAKDQQLKDLIDGHAAHVRDLVADHNARAEALHADCARELATTVAAFTDQLHAQRSDFRESLHQLIAGLRREAP